MGSVPPPGNQDRASNEDGQSIPLPNVFTLIQHALQNTQIPKEAKAEGTQENQNPDVTSANDMLDDMLVTVTSGLRRLMVSLFSAPTLFMVVYIPISPYRSDNGRRYP